VDSDHILRPNLAVVQNEDGDEWIFPSDGVVGPDVTEELCQFLFREDKKNSYIVAHNMRAFDGYFLLNWLVNNGMAPELIMNGGKILQCVIPKLGIEFRDSLNYNPQSLARWPETFGIPNVSKGTFPHRFNRPENWNNVVPYPELSDFGYILFFFRVEWKKSVM
jgi:hypothetical protein